MTDPPLRELIQQARTDRSLGGAIKRASPEEVQWASQALISLHARGRQEAHREQEGKEERLSQGEIENRLQQLGRLSRHVDYQLAATIGLSGGQPQAIIQNVHMDGSDIRELLGEYAQQLEDGVSQQEGREIWEGILLGDFLTFLEASLQAYAERFGAPLGNLTTRLLDWSKARRRNIPNQQPAPTTLQDAAQWIESLLLDLPTATSGLDQEDLWDLFRAIQEATPNDTFQLSNIATHPRANPRLWQRVMDSQPPVTVVRALVRFEGFAEVPQLREQARALGDPDVHLFLLDHLSGRELADVFMELVDLDTEHAFKAWFSPRFGAALQSAVNEEDLKVLLNTDIRELRRSAMRLLARRDVSSGSRTSLPDTP